MIKTCSVSSELAVAASVCVCVRVSCQSETKAVYSRALSLMLADLKPLLVILSNY